MQSSVVNRQNFNSPSPGKADGGENFDLNRYKEAADVAYRYAKQKLQKEQDTSTDNTSANGE